MTIIRLRYENGQLIPLDQRCPIWYDGDEIEMGLRHVDESGNLRAMLDRTRGLWAGQEVSRLRTCRRRWRACSTMT